MVQLYVYSNPQNNRNNENKWNPTNIVKNYVSILFGGLPVALLSTNIDVETKIECGWFSRRVSHVFSTPIC